MLGRIDKAMDPYNTLKDEVLNINRDVAMLFSSAKSMPGMADYSFGEWEKSCDHLPRQLAEDIIRVAIVGPIKSGKSTFLNSIFKGEFVKRGAGVITSIVTRVRNGNRLRAKMFFKSWDEINAEMEQALVLFPSANWRSDDSHFDIRQPKERLELKRDDHGLVPGQGPVLVTGAAGGVGSVATAILAHLGYEVAGVTGRPETADYLKSLGATQIVARELTEIIVLVLSGYGKEPMYLPQITRTCINGLKGMILILV